MDISDLLVSDSPYSKAKDLQPINEDCTIEETGTDEYPGDKKPFIFVKFSDIERPVRLNLKNSRGLAHAFGNDLDKWRGKTVTVMTIPSQTPAGEDTFGWLTVPKQKKPKAKPATTPVNATPDDDVPF
jgi:hypothetical protein